MIFGDVEYQANANKQQLRSKPTEISVDEVLVNITSEVTRLTYPYHLRDTKYYVVIEVCICL